MKNQLFPIHLKSLLIQKAVISQTNPITLLIQLVLGNDIIKITPELNMVTYIAIDAEETIITHAIVE